ncbi:hypothetical protein BS47DRAFT_1359207 [Hydnum rufescens UP504]|uniref:ABC transporter family G domain-containing protein n=1 Tax=Hydnum rufescens UP504 TaxID=1448309 RepID=A0A9P6DWY1_9AGAM|nr:hypothetical protein BS47DRAFT_1359207 [Hydnum rufescens UP504]
MASFSPPDASFSILSLSLLSLARNYNRTVVFTIHQLWSNIVAMFAHLLLAKGKLIYSGEVSKCHDYFVRIGDPCPPGFNIAHFSIDLTMQIETTSPGPSGTPPEREKCRVVGATSQTKNRLSRERPLPKHLLIPSGSSHSQVNADLDVPRSRTRPSSIADSISTVTKNAGIGAGSYVKRKTWRCLGTKRPVGEALGPPRNEDCRVQTPVHGART